MTLLLVFILLVFCHTLVSNRIERANLTAPIIFTGAGILALLVLPAPELRDQQANIEVLKKIAEVGLVLLLFTDASRTNLLTLKHIRNLPTRLLSVGMLLTTPDTTARTGVP